MAIKKKDNIAKGNILHTKEPISIKVMEEEEEKENLLMNLNSGSLTELRQKQLDERKKQLIIQSKEVDFNNAEIINSKINDILDSVTDLTRIQQLIQNVSSGKEFNEIVKATSGLLDIRDKMQDGLINEYQKPQKGTKIIFETHLQAADGSSVTSKMGVATE